MKAERIMKMKPLSRKKEANLRWNEVDASLIVRRNELEVSKRNLKKRITQRKASVQMLKRKSERYEKLLEDSQLLQENLRLLVNLVATSAQEIGGESVRQKLDK